ncbi:MAG: IS21 family transposase [Streptosporangiaceae bacterium]
MEILEAFDATGVAHSAAPLCNADPKTVRRYAQARDLGRPGTEATARPKLIDSFLDKIEEMVDRSEGKVRADIAHERLAAMGFGGSERTTRRAVAAAKARYQAGHRRTYRPWITEPGLWLQWDWGYGPQVPGPDGQPRGTLLFCAWLAWSRFRVVLPVWDRTLATLIACLDATLRRLGGVPAYALTDNEKTVTVEHVAGVPVRHPEIVAAGRHYGMTVHTCVPYDPETKGGSEATVRIAKADLVPSEANLLEAYGSFAELATACDRFCGMVNGRVHRETSAVPAARLEVERTRLHRLPDAPHTAALGQTRMVNTDQTIRFGSVRYSTPPGLTGAEVWVRADGDELVVVADLAALPLRPDWAGPGPLGLAEVARHRLSVPGNPQIVLAHYPGHPQHPDGTPRPPRIEAVTGAEEAFLGIGQGARAWLIEAAAAGATRVRAKMAEAVELAALAGTAAVDAALGTAALAGRFGDGDLLSITGYQAGSPADGQATVPDEAYSAQPGTAAWAGFGTEPGTRS